MRNRSVWQNILPLPKVSQKKNNPTGLSTMSGRSEPTSKSLISMNMVHADTKYPIMKNLPIQKLPQVVGKTIKVKIIVDTTTGIIKIYDPLVKNYYYEADLGGPLPKGSYFSFRTNSLSVVIDNFEVTIE